MLRFLETQKNLHFITPKGLPINFLIFCNRMDVQKIPKGNPFYVFRHYATYRRLQKNFEKRSEKFFPQFLIFLRAFVVSSCTKSGFRVLLSLRYGADLGRSRLVFQTLPNLLPIPSPSTSLDYLLLEYFSYLVAQLVVRLPGRHEVVGSNPC